MFSIWLRRVCLLAFCSSMYLTANAADAVPSHLVGTWGTGASLWLGKGPQTELHLRADGFGVFAGSSAEARRTDRVDDGKPGPRVIMGFPLQATVDGNSLTLLLLATNERDAKEAASMTVACSYETEVPTMKCTGKDKVLITMVKRSDVVPDEVMKLIESLRAKTNK
jgi:hypothetical protein